MTEARREKKRGWGGGGGEKNLRSLPYLTSLTCSLRSSVAKLGQTGLPVHHLIVCGHARLAIELNCKILLFSQFFFGSQTSASRGTASNPCHPIIFCDICRSTLPMDEISKGTNHHTIPLKMVLLQLLGTCHLREANFYRLETPVRCI